MSKHSREGRVGRGRWAVAAFSVAAMVFVTACSGDDDDNASSSEGTGAATASATGGSSSVDLQAELDAANATIADQNQKITDLNAQVTTANQAVTEAQSATATEKARADKAESDLADLQSQIDAVKAQFPITISSSLEPYTDTLVGAYTLHLTEAFCDGISTCGQQRPDIRSDIIQGPNGLELQVPNVFTTGLFMVEGALFGVTDSNLIAPACTDGTPTNSQVSTTIFANDVIVAADGTQTLSGLRASVMVAVNPAGSCGAGNVFFSGTLTPV